MHVSVVLATTCGVLRQGPGSSSSAPKQVCQDRNFEDLCLSTSHTGQGAFAAQCSHLCTSNLVHMTPISASVRGSRQLGQEHKALISMRAEFARCKCEAMTEMCKCGCRAWSWRCQGPTLQGSLWSPLQPLHPSFMSSPASSGRASSPSTAAMVLNMSSSSK